MFNISYVFVCVFMCVLWQSMKCGKIFAVNEERQDRSVGVANGSGRSRWLE